MRLALIPLAFAAVLAMGAAPPVVTPDGYGWLRLGMSDDEAKAAAPVPLKVGEGDDPASCEQYLIGDTNVVFMTSDGRVSRVSTYEPGATTADGIQVGDPAAKVLYIYGQKVIHEPAPYGEPPDEDLYVWLTPDRGYRFETSNHRITAIHAGSDTIRYIEGCL